MLFRLLDTLLTGTVRLIQGTMRLVPVILLGLITLSYGCSAAGSQEDVGSAADGSLDEGVTRDGDSDAGDAVTADSGPDGNSDVDAASDSSADAELGVDACTPFPELCNSADDDCDGVVDEGRFPDCEDACCDENFACDPEEGCLPVPCEGIRCGADESLCCTGDEFCWGDACIIADRPCDSLIDCPEDEICEPDLGVCVPSSGVSECEYRPPPGEFDPVLDCRWTTAGLETNTDRQDVVATPIVVNLTDDDGDGVTTRNDDPEIVFLTYNRTGDGCCNQSSTLRIVSGTCNDDGTMNTLASLNSVDMTNDAGIAAGDLDGDGVPEIVAVSRVDGRPQGVVAWSRAANDGSAWEVLWHNTTHPTWNVHTTGGATLSIANVDGFGAPEVIVGNVILSGLTGATFFDGAVTSDGDGGIGNNGFLGPAATVADLDLDGSQEILAGNTLYDARATPLWTFDYSSNNSPCGGDLGCDGFNAFGNFDDDFEGEIVIVRRGEVFVLEHTGEQLFKAVIPRDDCENNESGPPTVADFDGDGFPEIGTASADFYVVVDFDTCGGGDWSEHGCAARNILWTVPNRDCSSRATGSSVFDFEGDGRAEVVYADETTLRIFAGTTGEILYEDATHGSHTRIEMPVIADVDNDGNAEIVVPENNSNGGSAGIDVWADASDNWVRTRRIWNQHGYSITNVTEDGQIPVRPAPNWLEPRFNNFRQNVQPDAVFAAPDLVLSELDVVLDSSKCPFEVTFHINATVRNDGALSVPPGVPARIEIRKDDTVVVLQEWETTTRLFPGTSELYGFTVAFELDTIEPPFTIWASIDPDGAVNECDEVNNEVTYEDVDCTWVADE